MFRSLLRGFVFAVLLCACSRPATDQRGDAGTALSSAISATAKVPPEVDGRFIFASAVRSAGVPPPRFSAPLPSDLARGYPESAAHPPAGYVTALLCAADPKMLERVTQAVAQALAAGQSPFGLSVTIANLTRSCVPNPAYCQAAAALLAKSQEPATRLVASMMLAECGRREDVETFDRAETNALAIFHYLAARRLRQPKPFFTARVGSAALELATSLDDPLELRMAAFTLAAFDDPHAALALVAMHDVAKRHRQQIALAGIQSSDPKARAMGREACAELKTDSSCLREGSSTAQGPKAPKEDLRHPERLDLDRIVALSSDPHVSKNLGPLLRACAQSHRTSFGCVIRLQFFDRKRASELARKLRPREAFLEREQVAALAQFEAAEALGAELRRLGFQLPPDGQLDLVRTGVRPMLAAAGHMAVFDAAKDHSPNQHDILALGLARLARDFPETLFEEIPPKESAHGANYVLCGYARAEKWCTEAKNLGDWYDLGAVIGLLNAMARDLDLESRFASLATDNQFAKVVGGPALGLEFLSQKGLLVLGPTESASEWGRVAATHPSRREL